MEQRYGAEEHNKSMFELVSRFKTPNEDIGVLEEDGEYPLLYINQPGRKMAFDLSTTEVLLGEDKLTDILDKWMED
jgi:hypothetical protein